MNLSKSRFCSAVQCKKRLWLEINKPDEKEDIGNESVLENGVTVGAKAREYFGDYIEIPYSDNLEDMIKETNAALDNESVVIAEASFSFDNNFCSVDILKKDNDGLSIYEVKSSTEVKEIYLYDLAYQVFILNSLGYKVKQASIMYINSKYVRNGSLNLQELFCIEDLTSQVLSLQSQVIDEIKLINQLVGQEDEPIIDIGNHCVQHYKCPFFKYCIKHLPTQNVFNIRGMRDNTKFSLYKKGIFTYEQLLKENVDSKYMQQIEYEINDLDDYIDKQSIKEFLNTLRYPLYFLDFETYQQAIPEYDGVRPYMQIPFQYSLHFILDESRELEHREFLAKAGQDPRRDLATQLVHDIPENTCVVAYNMMFEKMVIKNLAELYPDLHDHLMNIYSNMKDLMIPFKNRDFYTRAMQGSYSIKYVLPALFPNDPSLDYHNLDLIHNGSEAMNTFAQLSTFPKEEQERVRFSLLRYCELDTYAMVKIWEYLKKQI